MNISACSKPKLLKLYANPRADQNFRLTTLYFMTLRSSRKSMPASATWNLCAGRFSVPVSFAVLFESSAFSPSKQRVERRPGSEETIQAGSALSFSFGSGRFGLSPVDLPLITPVITCLTIFRISLGG